MVRGFATGEVDPKRPMRVLPGEVALAFMIGVLAGILVGIGVATVFTTVPGLGWIVGIALLLSTVTAALAGTLIPFGCQAINVDPAYAAGPFLLTLNDLAAFSIYFAVALGLQDVFAGL
jgi:magnesium transporter